MHVLVPLERGKPARRHFEVAQLPLHLGVGEQHLPGDRLVQGAVVFLVGKLVHAFPAVRLRLAMDGSLVAHQLNRPDPRQDPRLLTSATKAAAFSATCSPASISAPPISNMTSAP